MTTAVDKNEQEYKFNAFAKILWLLLALVASYEAWLTFTSGESAQIVFFFASIAMGLAIRSLICFTAKITLDQTNLSLNLFFKTIHYSWDEINGVGIKGRKSLLFLSQWMTASRSLSTRLGWGITPYSLLKRLSVSDWTISNYRILLINIILHVKPYILVSSDILKYVKMTEDDVGKYYCQNIWIPSLSDHKRESDGNAAQK